MAHVKTCPMVAKVNALGCILNRVKYDSCKECPGVEGWLDEGAKVVQSIIAMLPAEARAMLPGQGYFVPIEAQTAKELERRGVTPANIAEWADFFLSGNLAYRKDVVEPCAKSRLRPEGT